MRATKVLWLLYLHLGPQSVTTWSKILQLTIETFVYSRKCEIKLPGCWGGVLRGKMGAGEGGRTIHGPGHLYIDYGCPMNINEQGDSKWGHQDEKMRPKPVGLL
jgi:hypothetical protein